MRRTTETEQDARDEAQSPGSVTVTASDSPAVAASPRARVNGACVNGGWVNLEARAEQVPAARDFVGRMLGRRHPCADTAVLLTSELVANSVRYSGCHRSGEPVTVTVSVQGTVVSIEVTDTTGPTVPQVRAEDGLAEGGRGLRLVEALAATWGYRSDGARTTTWFVCLPLPPPVSWRPASW